MIHSSSRPQFFDIIIIVVLIVTVFYSPSAVRSEQLNPLLLPSDQAAPIDDLAICPVTAGENSCPVKCFRPDPVCGVDGVTYWCGCADAHCAGTRVAKVGFCEVGNGGSGPFSGQALLLVHIIWLILLGIFVLFGLL